MKFKNKYKSPSIHQTPLYRMKAAYTNMKRRCGVEKAYKNVELKMSFEEWSNWALPLYEDFCKKYPRSIPVAARKKDLGHYELGNIRIISWAQNARERKRVPKVKLICPKCGISFERNGNRVMHKIRKGKSPCCSRKCGNTRTNHEKQEKQKIIRRIFT